MDDKMTKIYDPMGYWKINMLLRAVIFLINNQKIIVGMVSTLCCPNSFHPSSKIWINVSSVSSSLVIDYTFYDITREIHEIWAYEVDHSATVLKDDKIFEARTTSLLCPAGYESQNPHHTDIMD
uniref:Uncharacterized protein n=1 Tax=Romanomermis culicivorax TaxID=13658 RepID=A0A915L291_ROMCU